MRTPKVDTGAQARAEESARQARQVAENLRINMAQDLSASNNAAVVAGGSAEAVDDALRRKKATPGLASQLGLNV